MQTATRIILSIILNNITAAIASGDDNRHYAGIARFHAITGRAPDGFDFRNPTKINVVGYGDSNYI